MIDKKQLTIRFPQPVVDYLTMRAESEKSR